ncbi:MAG: hypothetical protein WAM30_17090, partial [Candidatus Dormiibacterota bacterium]
ADASAGGRAGHGARDVQAHPRAPYHAGMERRRGRRGARDPKATSPSDDQSPGPEEELEERRPLGDADPDDGGPEEGRVVVTHSLPRRYPAQRQPAAEVPGPEPDDTPVAAADGEAGAPADDEGPAEPAAAVEPPPATATPAVADTAPPTASVPADPKPTTRFSADGEFWWNGATWIPALSSDGLWRWDGQAWRLQVPSELDPTILVDGLAALAAGRHLRRGQLLVQRPDDWPVPDALGDTIDDALDLAEQRSSTERRLRGLETPGSRRIGGMLARFSGVDDDHQRLRAELTGFEDRLQPLLLRIGQQAPVPTFREADEVLETARRLTGAAGDVTTAHEAVLAAKAEWQARLESAQADVERASAERDARIAAAEAAVHEVEASREHGLADAWRKLAEVRMPGKGEHLASFGPIHLFEARIEMPSSAGPAAAARGAIGSAAELVSSESRALEDLFLVGDSGAADLHWAETNADPTPYLLVMTETGSALVSCGESEREARAFVKQLLAAAAAANDTRERRRTALADAYRVIQKTVDDRSAIEAAVERRHQTERDPELLGAIERARARVQQERESTVEIKQAEATLRAIIEQLTTAPAPLEVA